jgi:predicted nucleic acid-binding Zn ribbon protein
MSEKSPLSEEEKQINHRSFIIGMFIAAAFIILFVILYYLGLMR